MIVKKEFEKVLNSVKGNKLYFNPNYCNNPNLSFDVAPLISNKILIYLTKKTKKDILDKVEFFNQENFIVPVSISEETLPDNLDTEKSILRKKIFDESLFDRDYKEMIEEDQEDIGFRELIKKTLNVNEENIKKVVNTLAFSTNWDLLLIKSFKLPIYSSSGFEKIFKYKINRIDESFISPSRPIQNSEEIAQFLNQINIIFPSKLTIDQIKEFRKEKIAIQFRNWLERKLNNVEEIEENEKIQYLIQEFNKVSESYKNKIKAISSSIGTITGAITGVSIGGSYGGAVGGGIIGNIIGPSASYPIKKLWKNLGPNRWVFLLADFKKKVV